MLATHLTTAELQRAMRHGFDAAGRCRAVQHFDCPCTTCLQVLAKTAEVPDLPVSGPGWESGPGDPVARVVSRLVLLRAGDERQRHSLLALRPAYRYWLRSFPGPGPGFCRLVLEEGYELLLDDPAKGVGSPAAALAAVADGWPEAGRGKRFHDLMAVAHAYCASSHVATGQHKMFCNRLELAQQSYRNGTGDPEVEATILEIASQGSAGQGLDFQAAEDSRRAVERLAETTIPGRRAWALHSMALCVLALDRAEALAALKEALPELDEEPEQMIRLYHLQLFAMAEDAAGRPAASRQWFARARPLYRKWPRPKLAAVRLYYLGVFRRRANQFRSAWVLLSAAADSLFQVGEIRDAAGALMELGKICQATGGVARLREVQERLLAMLPLPEDIDPIHSWSLFRAMRWAQALGIPVANERELAALVRSRQAGDAAEPSDPAGGSHDDPDQ